MFISFARDLMLILLDNQVWATHSLITVGKLHIVVWRQ